MLEIVQKFLDNHLKLLHEEYELELAEITEVTSRYSHKTLQRYALALTNLIADNIRTGLGGHSLIDLRIDPALRSNHEENLPDHPFEAGDVALLRGVASKGKDDPAVELTVVRVHSSYLTMSIDTQNQKKYDNLLESSSRFWLCKMANHKTYKRLFEIMKLIQTETIHSDILKTVLPNEESKLLVSTPSVIQDWFNSSLNQSQRCAVEFAVATSNIALIHGPPGTGKTSTLIEIVDQILKKDKDAKILICGPSNISVDNVLERLDSKYKMIRLGHPARVLSSIVSHTLDYIIQSSNNSQIVRELYLEIDQKLKDVTKSKSYSERKQLYTEINLLRKDSRKREKEYIKDLVKSANIILATTHGAGGSILKDVCFDYAILDEASQALEAQALIPAAKCKRFILAGDHLQLPPILKTRPDASCLKSKNSKRPIYSMFERLIIKYEASHCKFLDTQYRMNKLICEFPSKHMYKNRLKTFPKIENQLLSDLNLTKTNIQQSQIPYLLEHVLDTALVFYDTQGDAFQEMENISDIPTLQEQNSSKLNPYEAQLAIQHVTQLISNGVSPSQIAILSPYKAQVAHIRSLIHSKYPEVEIGSIDGMQGREKECVIISFVRSNIDRVVGFLAEEERINVAITRAKRQLTVIGDSLTLRESRNEFLSSYMDFLEESAELIYPEISYTINNSL